MCAKLSTRDLIIDYQYITEHTSGKHIYTLVCRADLHKTNSWNLIPDVDIATFNDDSKANEYCNCVNQVLRYQAIKYPGVPKIRECLQSEIDSFRKIITQLHPKIK